MNTAQTPPASPSNILKAGDDKELLDCAEAAKFLGISSRTLDDWRYHSRGPRYVALSSRAVRYRRADLLDFIEDHMVDPGKATRGQGADHA